MERGGGGEGGGERGRVRLQKEREREGGRTEKDWWGGRENHNVGLKLHKDTFCMFHTHKDSDRKPHTPPLHGQKFADTPIPEPTPERLQVLTLSLCSASTSKVLDEVCSQVATITVCILNTLSPCLKSGLI